MATTKFAAINSMLVRTKNPDADDRNRKLAFALLLGQYKDFEKTFIHIFKKTYWKGEFYIPFWGDVSLGHLTPRNTVCKIWRKVKVESLLHSRGFFCIHRDETFKRPYNVRTIRYSQKTGPWCWQETIIKRNERVHLVHTYAICRRLVKGPIPKRVLSDWYLFNQEELLGTLEQAKISFDDFYKYLLTL